MATHYFPASYKHLVQQLQSLPRDGSLMKKLQSNLLTSAPPLKSGSFHRSTALLARTTSTRKNRAGLGGTASGSWKREQFDPQGRGPRRFIGEQSYGKEDVSTPPFCTTWCSLLYYRTIILTRVTLYLTEKNTVGG